VGSLYVLFVFFRVLYFHAVLLAMQCRLSFVGELGFEVHCATDDVKMIYDAVMGEMDKHNACVAGFRAMESLSSETGASEKKSKTTSFRESARGFFCL